MARIMFFIAALAVSLALGCRRERSEPAATPKTTEPAAAAQDEAEAALETAREAKETADSALETAREAQAAAASASAIGAGDGRAWWTRAVPTAAPTAAATAPGGEAVEQSALIEADRISVSGRVTESDGQRVVVAPVAGEPMTVQVDGATRVALDGRPASAAELAPGTRVRLLYRLDGAQLIAERLDGQR